jgi:formamidopyrimidine-DNA glycosylase
MLEFPEAVVIAEQLNKTIKGKRIMSVTTQKSPHKFAWFNGDPQAYDSLFSGKAITKAVQMGGMAELQAENTRLVFNDGVNLRFYQEGEKLPDKHQLDIAFEDHSHLIGSVQMYGGLNGFIEGEFDSMYYKVALEKPSPLSAQFDEVYFNRIIQDSPEKLSLKGLLATEQRIPGLGNGVLQDILFYAGLHPKKKINTLTEGDKKVLFQSIKTTLAEMIARGGRDTERDLFGCLGGYTTQVSKNTLDKPCKRCGGEIKKEAYMGGSIYYCQGCQTI